MSLFSQWQEKAQSLSNDAAYQKFWNEYFAAETEAYKQVLLSHLAPLSGTVKELAEKLGMDTLSFVGFLDGANTSFSGGEKDLEALEENSSVTLDFDFEKLYFNMHEAKAQWLFTLPEWEAVLSEEKRHEITKAYRASKIFVAPVQVGRNDPCPCGSGKKYKNCCGKNK